MTYSDHMAFMIGLFLGAMIALLGLLTFLDALYLLDPRDWVRNRQDRDVFGPLDTLFPRQSPEDQNPDDPPRST